jgi:hypothetical protein
MSAPPVSKRDWTIHPPYLYEPYASTVRRSPRKALVPLEPSLSELTGPAFGSDAVRPEDADLTRIPGGSGQAIGQRIHEADAAFGTLQAARSPTRWSRSGRRTRPAGTFTTSIATMRRSIRISPAAGAA